MSDRLQQAPEQNPLASLDEWEDFLQERYPAAAKRSRRSATTATNVRPGVREFYRLNHRHQTLDFVRRRSASILPRTSREMGIWEAMEFLNTLVDDSDPDTDLTQIEHLMQTSEAIRADGHPRWFILTGPDPRPGQGALPLRRAAMGRRRRHVSRRLPLFRQGRLPRVLRGQSRLRTSPSTRPSAGSTSRDAGSTESTCRGATTNICTTSSRTICPTRGWR